MASSRDGLAGEESIIGSRSRAKAEGAAAEVSEQVRRKVRAGTNLEAAQASDLIVLSVPFDGMKKIIDEVIPALGQGKILINVAVPLKFRRVGVTVAQPKAGSTAEALARLVPKGVKVISAFQTVGAKGLQEISKPVDCDIVVCGNDEDAKRRVMLLVEKIEGLRAVDGGPLRNSRFLEPIVALLVELTRRRGVPGVVIRFEGL